MQRRRTHAKQYGLTWRGEEKDSDYEDQTGYCKSATLEDIKHCVKHSKKRNDPQHIIDDHISFRDHIKIRVKNEQALLTKLESQFFSQGGTFE